MSERQDLQDRLTILKNAKNDFFWQQE